MAMSGGMWLLPVSNKIFFTFFLSIMAIAVGLGFLTHYDRTGFSFKKTERYYCGDKDEELDAPPASVEENNARLQEGLFFPKTYRELLGTTHTHIFSIPIVIFILSRIMAMTHAREGLKITVYSGSFSGILLNLASPWLIRYVCPHFVIVSILSSILLIFSFGAYLFIPLYEMWFRKEHNDA